MKRHDDSCGDVVYVQEVEYGSQEWGRYLMRRGMEVFEVVAEEEHFKIYYQ